MNRALVLLSGEGTSLPAAEARALFLAYDPFSRFEAPEKRVLIVETKADPTCVARRIAFARRVGLLVEEPSDASEIVRGRNVRVRSFSIGGSKPKVEPHTLLEGLDVDVDLENPEFEFSVVEGERRYIALTLPSVMRQDWYLRRPRRRAFFHPSAIFPKLSRALVNLTQCLEGEVLLDPFAGTGSILIEAAEAGLQPVAMDLADEMARGSVSNMRKLGHSWLGVIRGDAFTPPVSRADGVATDVPYGRASSTRGREPDSVIGQLLGSLPQVTKKGSRVVIMHPRQLVVHDSDYLSVEEEHYLHVHKRLTRAITVLRRE